MEINYHAVPIDWRRGEKTRFLDKACNHFGIQWQKIEPNKKDQWLTHELRSEFDQFVAIGNKVGKGSGDNVVFRNFGNGVKTNRDDWAWNFDARELKRNIETTI